MIAQRLGRLLNCQKVLNDNKAKNEEIIDTCLVENSTLLARCLKFVEAKKIAEICTEDIIVTNKFYFIYLKNPQ